MKRVLIEAPYDQDNSEDLRYLERAFADSVLRGEAPFAPQVFYTIFLDVEDPRDADLAFHCAEEWAKVADILAVYVDYGTILKSREKLVHAKELGMIIEFRKIGMNLRFNRP